MGKNFTILNGKTIRDPVHGDIFFSEKFLAIIDTPEFQRLRRIRQLSILNLVFPGAEHTRFSHSIGAYYIMQKIVGHFKPVMRSINLELDERDINLAFAVALLHDIGHGPFSHTFENLMPGMDDHEQWGIKIITDKDSNINRVLKDKFDKDFPNDLADIIRKEKTVKKKGFKYQDYKEIDLFFILSALISSQLDADRMDYLLRDTKYTGAIFGNIDIERLISSMTLTVNKDNHYVVCFIDKFLSDIENYLLARYQMYKEIYLHSVECEMEVIIKKIFERSIQIINNNNEYIKNTMPEPLLELFLNKSISLQDYVCLDDDILLSTFSKWTKSEDPILSKLCCCIINRQKYNKVRILNSTEQEIDAFKKELKDVLSGYGYNVNNYNEEYFWIELTKGYDIYKNKENILILKDDGTINDICSMSKIIDERLNGEKTMTFINYDILKEVVGIEHGKSAINDVKNLIKMHNNRSHIEIEKKYIFDKYEVFNKVEKTITEWNEYEVDRFDSVKTQEDYYYDTDDRYLLNEDKTLRFRKTSDDFQLTIKTPTKAGKLDKGDTGFQNERFEYEMQVDSENKNDNRHIIIKYLPELNEEEKWNNLKKSLTVVNERRKINLFKNDVRFEMVFDNVNYININGKEKADFQIEIELKSNYIHRINLKILSDYLEQNVPELKPTCESKYRRGINLTK